MRLFSYVVARDYGFAPNPFFGVCTLATCKPEIRKTASAGDWIIGTGSSQKGRQGYLVYAMCLTETMTFNEYWEDKRFQRKKPNLQGVRNRPLAITSIPRVIPIRGSNRILIIASQMACLTSTIFGTIHRRTESCLARTTHIGAARGRKFPQDSGTAANTIFVPSATTKTCFQRDWSRTLSLGSAL